MIADLVNATTRDPRSEASRVTETVKSSRSAMLKLIVQSQFNPTLGPSNAEIFSISYL